MIKLIDLLLEKHMTPSQKKKRGQIFDKLVSGGMEKSKAGAIATSKAINEAWVDSKQIINSVVAMIKKAPKEDQERLANIAKIMYNYPWYWEMSDARNTEEKARAKNAMIKKFYNELENEESEDIAIEIYNAYAPGGSFRTVSEPYLSRTTTNL